MDRLRRENERLEERCRELEAEIQARNINQDLIDERLDEQKRLITQLEKDPTDVAQQATYLNSHIGGLPRTVYIPKQGRKYHLDPQYSSLTQSTEIKDYDYCSMCVNRVTPVHRRPLGSNGGT